MFTGGCSPLIRRSPRTLFSQRAHLSQAPFQSYPHRSSIAYFLTCLPSPQSTINHLLPSWVKAAPLLCKPQPSKRQGRTPATILSPPPQYRQPSLVSTQALPHQLQRIFSTSTLTGLRQPRCRRNLQWAILVLKDWGARLSALQAQVLRHHPRLAVAWTI